jgi:hypothetical protein
MAVLMPCSVSTKTSLSPHSLRNLCSSDELILAGHEQDEQLHGLAFDADGATVAKEFISATIKPEVAELVDGTGYKIPSAGEVQHRLFGNGGNAGGFLHRSAGRTGRFVFKVRWVVDFVKVFVKFDKIRSFLIFWGYWQRVRFL